MAGVVHPRRWDSVYPAPDALPGPGALRAPRRPQRRCCDSGGAGSRSADTAKNAAHCSSSAPALEQALVDVAHTAAGFEVRPGFRVVAIVADARVHPLGEFPTPRGRARTTLQHRCDSPPPDARTPSDRTPVPPGTRRSSALGRLPVRRGRPTRRARRRPISSTQDQYPTGCRRSGAGRSRNLLGPRFGAASRARRGPMDAHWRAAEERPHLLRLELAARHVEAADP